MAYKNVCNFSQSAKFILTLCRVENPIGSKWPMEGPRKCLMRVRAIMGVRRLSETNC